MKEKPIIFNSEMIRAILDDRKTQTRRIVKPQPSKENHISWGISERPFWYEMHRSFVVQEIKCPYGKLGDRLWVRESFGYDAVIVKGAGNKNIKYKVSASGFELENYKWKPSIHMPRWASRITLEITDIRVERLREISLDDINSEGVKINTYPYGKVEGMVYFRELWNSIAKDKYKWQDNPWVWVIEFKRRA